MEENIKRRICLQITSLCRFIYERPNVEVRNMELKAMTILRWQACDGSNYFKVCSSLLENTQNDEVSKKNKNLWKLATKLGDKISPMIPKIQMG